MLCRILKFNRQEKHEISLIKNLQMHKIAFVHFSRNLRHPTVSFFGTPRNYINLYSSLIFHFKLLKWNKRKTKVHSSYLPIPEHSGLRVMSSMAMSPRKRMPLFPMNWIVYLYIWIALLVQKGKRRIGEDETKANLAWQRQSVLAHTKKRTHPTKTEWDPLTSLASKQLILGYLCSSYDLSIS